MAAKLLFDENLAPRLARDLADLFPGSRHVEEMRLGQAIDDVIWESAAAVGFVIVTKDDDSRQRSFLRGHPESHLASIWKLFHKSRCRCVAQALRRT